MLRLKSLECTCFSRIYAHWKWTHFSTMKRGYIFWQLESKIYQIMCPPLITLARKDEMCIVHPVCIIEKGYIFSLFFVFIIAIGLHYWAYHDQCYYCYLFTIFGNDISRFYNLVDNKHLKKHQPWMNSKRSVYFRLHSMHAPRGRDTILIGGNSIGTPQEWKQAEIK